MTTEVRNDDSIDCLKPTDYDEHPERYKVTRLVIVSDTHNKHDWLVIPDGDIFIHCGDFTNREDWYNLADNAIPKSVINFNRWLGTLPHRHKLVVTGNHDIGFAYRSAEEIQSTLLTNAVYVNDRLIDIEGMSIFGCSWKNSRHEREGWSSIPSDLDLLITHIPPRSILDSTYKSKWEQFTDDPYKQCGSRSLHRTIQQRIHPRVHCFGHIHDASGHTFDSSCPGTLFINAAVPLRRQATTLLYYVPISKTNLIHSP